MKTEQNQKQEIKKKKKQKKIRRPARFAHSYCNSSRKKPALWLSHKTNGEVWILIWGKKEKKKKKEKKQQAI